MTDLKGCPNSIPEIRTVTSISEYLKVLSLRQEVYMKVFPSINSPGKPDHFDFGDTKIWFTTDQYKNVDSTARLVLDGVAGLPSEVYLRSLLEERRASNQCIAEYGRRINLSAHKGISRRYFKQLFLHAHTEKIDTIVTVVRQSERFLYLNEFGASLLSENIKTDYGCGENFCVIAWDLAETNTQFFSFCRLVKNTQERGTSK